MKNVFSLRLILAKAVLSTSAQSAPQDLPAAQQFRAWLVAFNSGNRATLLHYLERNRPDSVAPLDDELDFRSQTGGFELKKIETSTAASFTAVVKERDSEQFARLEMEVEPEASHRIIKLGFRAIPTPAEFAIPRRTRKAPAAIRTRQPLGVQQLWFSALRGSDRKSHRSE
jgi:hypothetical protein